MTTLERRSWELGQSPHPLLVRMRWTEGYLKPGTGSGDTSLRASTNLLAVSPGTTDINKHWADISALEAAIKENAARAI